MFKKEKRVNFFINMNGFSLISILLVFTSAYGQGIKTLSPCVGLLDDGRFIDLSSLDDPKNPL